MNDHITSARKIEIRNSSNYILRRFVLNSRERVEETLSHNQPDRIPMDLWGSASRIHTARYIELVKELGLPLGERIRPGTTTEYEDYSLADIFDCDFRHINIGRPSEFSSYYDNSGNCIDEWGIGRKILCFNNTVTFHPFADASLAELRKHKWPNPKDSGRISGIGERAANWYHKTDKAITATAATSGLIFEFGQYLCGTENFLAYLYEEEKFCDGLIDKLTELFIELNLHYIKPIAPYIQWIEFTSDLGMQHAPFMSVQMFRRFFKNPMKQLFGAIKKAHPSVKIFFHSCGSIYSFIPDLIDCGVEILNPLQPLARDMDASRIKHEFGRDLVFHGGVDIQHALISTREELHMDIQRCIDCLADGGGYILSPANHLQVDVPNENIIELYRYAKEIGVYARSGE